MGKNKSTLIWLSMIFLANLALSCAPAKKGEKTTPKVGQVTPDGRVISKETRRAFDAAVEIYKKAEKAGWPPPACEEAIAVFQALARENGNMVEALYNVAVIYRNCGKKNESKQAFNELLRMYPKDQRSLTHLAIFALEEGNASTAEGYLKKAVSLGMNRLEVVPALVNVAIILSKRAAKGDEDAFNKAVLNIRRALAIDANYVEALYHLGLLYYNRSIQKGKASFLDLATLVCQQAIKINPEYGAIYHLLGQVQLQQEELVKALQSFKTAFEKDSSLFESYMNYAAINLNFRGYDEAKVAFEKAIALDPKNYDSHIGLGVALRGLGDFKGARTEYKKAAQLNPNRTDYIFNVGVLEMDYENPGTPAGYNKAKKVFKKFLARATEVHKVDPDGNGPEKSWVEKAQKRIAACDKAIRQIAEAEREMKEMERLAAEAAKQQAEMEAKMRKAQELQEKEAAGQEAPEEGAAPAVEEKAPSKETEKKEDKAKAEEKKADDQKAEKAKSEDKKTKEKKSD